MRKEETKEEGLRVLRGSFAEVLSYGLGSGYGYGVGYGSGYGGGSGSSIGSGHDDENNNGLTPSKS